MATIDIPSYLEPFTKTFYGLTDSTSEENKKRDGLYQEFLITNQLKDSDVSQATPEQQALYLAQFAQFLEQQLENIYQSESVIALSPEEMAKRNILFEAFATVLKMMNALQDTVRKISQSLVFYTKWQNQYTDMMTKIPLYVQGASAKVSYNAVNFGKTGLGYGNVQIEDMIDYLLYSRKEQIANNQSGVMTQYFGKEICFQLYYGPGIVKFLILKPGTFPEGGGPLSEPTAVFSGSNIAVPSRPEDLLSISSVIAEDMKRAIANSSGALANTMRNGIQNGTLLGMGWHQITEDADDDDKNKARSGNRGEINGKLQLCIENARSLRQQVQDRLQPIQDILSQTREAIQSQSNLLSSITDSLKGLIAAIFR